MLTQLSTHRASGTQDLVDLLGECHQRIRRFVTLADAAAPIELAVTALALETHFEEHLRLEESVIFPAIRELLSRETQTSIVNELRKRRQGIWQQPGPAPLTTREDEL